MIDPKEYLIFQSDGTSSMVIEENFIPMKSDDIFVNIRTVLPLSNGYESILTLLLKVLHKQRSNDFLDLISNLSLQPRTTTMDTSSRIGDGFRFISNIFRLCSDNNEQCRLIIHEEIEKLKVQYQQRQPATTKASDLTAEQK